MQQLARVEFPSWKPHTGAPTQELPFTKGLAAQAQTAEHFTVAPLSYIPRT